ncbi:MAG: YdcF family protein, partial [Ruminiclostridium sp.]|nr:YdcF family protein [Ruminiclostridium sp.]
MDKDKPRNKIITVLSWVLRAAVIVLCAGLLYTFIYTMSLGQVNYGNIAGCAYFGGVIVLIVVFPLVGKKKPLRIAATVCAWLAALVGVYFAVISTLIVSEIWHGEDNAEAVAAMNDGTPQTVIVLGCMVLDGEPSPMLAIRLQKAEEYLKSHPNAVCVVAGGKGSNEEISEAECMFRYLTRHGIDESRIFKEDRSVDTTENLRFSNEIIESEGLPKNVVVVSECYHIYRGVRQAKLNGLSAAGIYPDPDPVIITMPSYWVREIFAITR